MWQKMNEQVSQGNRRDATAKPGFLESSQKRRKEKTTGRGGLETQNAWENGIRTHPKCHQKSQFVLREGEGPVTKSGGPRRFLKKILLVKEKTPAMRGAGNIKTVA